MRINWNEKYTTISVYAFIVSCLSMLFYQVLNNFNLFSDKVGVFISTLQPFIIGCVLAYLLNFVLKFYENLLNRVDSYSKLSKKLQRTISMMFTYLSAGVITYLLIIVLVPQISDSLIGLANSSPEYLSNLTASLEGFINKFELDPQYLSIINDKINELANYTIGIFTSLIPLIGNFLFTIASSIWNIVLGLIISIYILLDKERFLAGAKKVTLAVYREKTAESIFALTYRSNRTFSKFISGKIIDSVIIGILTFIVLAVTKMPYTTLISVIIGITNIIPFFGPFIGAIPSALLVLVAAPSKTILFIIIIFVIQQIDGNIIGPKILGDSIGISAFWILFSLLVAGKFFGLVGMIIGVPLFAIIYSVLHEIVDAKLRHNGLPDNIDFYVNDRK